MSYFLQHQRDNIWLGKFGLFPEDLVAHGISARLGGVSEAPYASLNLGLHVGDDPEKVWENRRRLAAALELKAEDICSPRQVHKDKIKRVTAAQRGCGSRDYAGAIADTDALITNEPGLPLLLCYADCTPLLFCDPVHSAIGVAHAGWKGTLAEIGVKTLRAMEREFGTLPEECLAGIGPAIGPCCYEVGADTAEKFRRAFPQFSDKILSSDLHLNLWEANRLQLLEAGIKDEHLECAAACTACEENWYFSYRAEGGKTGRLGAIMALKKY